MENQESDFDRFWNAYPVRKGDRAKQMAKVLFEKFLKSGVPSNEIIHGAAQYASVEASKVGTEFIMQAQRWLRNKRWLDFPLVAIPVATITANSTSARYFITDDTPQWQAWQSYLRKTTGKGSPNRNFGWWFPSEVPPHE